MRRGYLSAPVIIILAIITLAVAFVIYFNTNLIKQSKSQPTPTSQTPSDVVDQQSDETASWKTYSSQAVSFKYPQVWSLNPNDENAIVLKQSSNQEGASVIIYMVDNPKELSIDQAVTIEPKDGGVCCISRYLLNENIEREQLTIDGFQATRFINSLTGSDNVYILKSGKIINISNNFGGVPKSTFDQILSTFRFAE